MEERQKNTPTPDSTTAFERQRKRKVILVAAVGSCLVIAFIWFLFKPAPTIGEGQAGINVPNSRERTALKEALASVGQTAGTSVNITHSAGQQVLAELARGGIQASSRYLSEKLREVRITLKANHQILLISKENQTTAP